MRKIPAIVTTLAMAGLWAAALPTGSAQAATCAGLHSSLPTQYVYAYDAMNCDSAELGRAVGNDQNWGDSGGSFQGGDTNKASSVINLGLTSQVKFYNGTGAFPNGGYICLSRVEGFVRDLSDDFFTSGPTVNNAISSHQWVASSACSNWAT
ncbi:hypothetical protein [Streptomyces niveus]|uniref:hypothetical protein n=1 Tax=Streptomyces niveus TaxID=193462 RepID=UPI0033A5A992